MNNFWTYSITKEQSAATFPDSAESFLVATVFPILATEFASIARRRPKSMVADHARNKWRSHLTKAILEKEAKSPSPVKDQTICNTMRKVRNLPTETAHSFSMTPSSLLKTQRPPTLLDWHLFFWSASDPPRNSAHRIDEPKFVLSHIQLPTGLPQRSQHVDREFIKVVPFHHWSSISTWANSTISKWYHQSHVRRQMYAFSLTNQSPRSM